MAEQADIGVAARFGANSLLLLAACWVFGGTLLAGATPSNPTEPVGRVPLRPAVSPRLNEDSFIPVLARYVRMTIEETCDAEAGLDEFEVFSPAKPERNVASARWGTKVQVSGTIGGFAIHQPQHLNDGLYGNEHSWVAGPEQPAWLQLELPEETVINRVVWSRDRTGQFRDRVATRYRIEVARATNAWQEVASSANRVHGVNGAFVMADPAAGMGWWASGVNPQGPVNPWLRGPEDYIMSHWDIEAGLPQNSVTAIAQTPDGYLWLGTFNGLARFDGVRFKVFNSFTKPAVANARIVGLYADKQTRLWIADEGGGITLLEYGQFRRIPPPRGGIARWLVDGADRVLVGNGLGLFKWDGLAWQPWPPSRSLNWLEWPFLVAGSEQTVWICSKNRLGRIQREEFQESPYPAGEEPFWDGVLAPAQDGGLWVSDSRGWLRKIAPNGDMGSAKLTPWAGMGRTWVLREDRFGNLWAGTEDRGLFCLKAKGAALSYSATNGLCSSHIKAVFEDREGNIWVGTDGGGLSRLKPRALWGLTLPTSLGEGITQSVCAGADGAIWIGVAGVGVCRFQRDGIWPVPLGPRGKFAWSTLVDRTGGLWAGTYDRGILRLNDDRLETHGFARNWGGNWVALCQDRDGIIWAGGAVGLARLEGGCLRAVELQSGFTGGHVRALAEDRDGSFWVATSDAGVFRRARGEAKFEHLRTEQGLAANQTWSLGIDSRGGVWIGTQGAGLSYFKNGRFSTINSEQGLPSGVICGIIEDDAGRLWMSSNRGIFWADLNELEEFAGGRRKGVFFSQYGREDGMMDLECTGGSCPTTCKSADGNLWFTTVKGPVVVDPGRLIANTNPPPVWIEEITLDGTVISINEVERGRRQFLHPIAVPAGTRRLEFAYTGVSLVAPHKVRFKHRLAGFDNDWVDDGSQRVAQYTRLHPGRYRFLVLAANNDGVWNENGAEVAIMVLPYFWETAWFKIGGLASLAALLAFAYRTRFAALERRRLEQESFSRQLIDSQENERKRIARELHDGLGQNLLLIKNRAALGLSGPAESARLEAHLEAIAQMSSTVIQEARQIAHDLRPPQFESAGLSAALRAMLAGVAQAARFTLEYKVEDLDGALPPQDEINLYRVVQEALNNVLKHAEARNVRIEARRDVRQLEVEILDNGQGFDPRSVRSRQSDCSGMGISGIEERVRLMGGRAVLDSAPGRGTKLSISVPIPHL